MTTLGISAPSLTLSKVVALAQLAEDVGFGSLWLQDGSGRSALLMATVALERTERLMVGIGITSPFAYHPAALAVMTATLNEAYQGRFKLGIGLGTLGSPHARPIAAMQEALLIIRGMLRGDRVEMDGLVFSAASSLPFSPMAMWPVYLGAIGPQMLKLACAAADGIVVSRRATWCLPYVQYVVARAQVAGVDTVGFLEMSVTGQEARRRLWKLAINRNIQAISPYVLSFAGDEGRRLAQAQELLQQGDTGSALTLLDERLTAQLAIGGTAEECAVKLRPYTALGMGTLVMHLNGPQTESQVVALAAALSLDEGAAH